jgi:glycosyltransferase involved in cell wall biosynthesis
MERKVDIVDERIWHIGSHVQALDAFGAMNRVYGGFPAFRYRRVGITPQHLRTFPVAALWNHLRRKARLPRKLGLNEPAVIGRWVASFGDLAKYVCSYGTAYRFLFPRLKNRGNILILEAGAMHVEDHFHFIEKAKAQAGFPYSKVPPPAILDEIEKARLAHFVVAGSMMVKESYTKRGFPQERILCCPYGINSERFVARPTPPGTGSSIKIGCVGIVGIRKGIWRLIRIAEWAKQRGFKLDLWLIGPVDPEALMLLSKTDVSYRLFGVQKGQALVDLLHQCDLYGICSYEEGFPISLLEAMSTGLPAIVSNDTGAREAITEGEDGLILNHFNDEEFDQKLAPLLSNPQKLAAMSKAAHQKVQENYTLKHYAERIRSEYTRMFEMVESYGSDKFPSCFETSNGNFPSSLK